MKGYSYNYLGVVLERIDSILEIPSPWRRKGYIHTKGALRSSKVLLLASALPISTTPIRLHI